ncbi:MAG: helix-turn-helix domain-containing protein [Planctomycetes bacterium]|nr:helix-turn-helix domain-containing protein [Planctomycetota bacterium]
MIFNMMAMMEATFVSPAQVSRALGVSTSTIKRWVDQGVLPAHRTAGGHRKLLRVDVLRLVREGNFPRLDLRLLELPVDAGAADTNELSRRLFEGLRQGDISLCRSVIHGAYATGLSMETLGDEVIAPAMSRLGESWQQGRIDVMHEHRGTLLCTGVLHELRPALEANAQQDRPVAVGGNPEGDHSSLASLLIQLMLLDAGWDAINLGPNTPLASLRVAIRELQPRLAWLSASHLPDPDGFLADYRDFHDQARAAGVAVAVGGKALHGWAPGTLPATLHGSCLADMAKLARTLHPRPRPPKKGRPANQVS